MNFGLVLKYLVELFNANHISYAVIGGLALDFHGLVRATQDIDIMIPSDKLGIINDFLTTHGYKLFFKTEEVASYVSEIFELGRVDFMLAHRKYSIEMLNNAIPLQSDLVNGKVMTVTKEDLIGLKLQAYLNRNERKITDLDDIRKIISRNKNNLQFEKLKKYAILLQAEDTLRQLWGDGYE